MSFDVIQKSYEGRRFGRSATGGILVGKTSATGGILSHLAEISSAGKFESSVDGASAIGQWGSSITGYKGFIETVTGSNVTMSNYGLSHLTSDVPNGSSVALAAPEIGIKKEIYFDSSASTLSIVTAGAQNFGASVDSSEKNVDAAGGVRGTSVVLIGLSDSRWAMMGGRELGD